MREAIVTTTWSNRYPDEGILETPLRNLISTDSVISLPHEIEDEWTINMKKTSVTLLDGNYRSAVGR